MPSEPRSTFTELKKVTSDSFSATGLCAGGAADTAPGRTSWAPGSSHDVSERREAARSDRRGEHGVVAASQQGVRLFQEVHPSVIAVFLLRRAEDEVDVVVFE